MSAVFGPLDELMGCLLETWENRYDFRCDREKRCASFDRGGMQVQVDELPTGQLRVIYEHALHETTTELCTPAEAGALVEAILFRDKLCRVPLPSGEVPRKPWWRRILGQ
jgi:hypothetical protein